MTTTLLKHEWLRTRGTLGTVFGVAVLVVVAGGLLGMTGWPLLSGLGFVLSIGVTLVLVPVVQLGLAVDYWRSGYGRTGYFTHSIPVRGSTIYWTKLLWALAVSLVAVVVTVVLGVVVWWALARMSELPAPALDVIGELWAGLNSIAPGWMIAAGLLLFLASYLIWPVYYYFSVSVGNESRLSGLGVAGPIVVFVLLYVVIQVLSLAGMFAVPFGIGVDNEQLGFVSFNLVSEMMPESASSGDVMPLGFLLPMALIAGFCLWRTARSWNRKVSLA